MSNFDFRKITTGNLTPSYILSKVSDTQIFYYYFGPFETGKRYPSKFRRDSNPSTSFYYSKSGKLIYNDFKTGEKDNCFTFVQRLFNIGFKDALYKIASDFNIICSNEEINFRQIQLSEEFDRKIKKETIIQIVPEKWNRKNLHYWRQYEISQEELEDNRVYSIGKLFLNKKEILNKNDENRYAFLEESEGKSYLKIYCPNGKIMKWITNIPLNIPFGLNDLEKEGDLLIVTKSKKDLIILKKFFRNVIATQNESEAAFTPELQQSLCNRFTKRIIIWDNDPTGNNKNYFYERDNNKKRTSS